MTPPATCPCLTTWPLPHRQPLETRRCLAAAPPHPGPTPAHLAHTPALCFASVLAGCPLSELPTVQAAALCVCPGVIGTSVASLS